MRVCLDTTCNFSNPDSANTCAQCGLPLNGTLLQNRYHINQLVKQERGRVTLSATDQQDATPVTIRALVPNTSNDAERKSFLEDAELAVALSAKIEDADSVRVLDYGRDENFVFLVKTVDTVEPKPVIPKKRAMPEMAPAYYSEVPARVEDSSYTQIMYSIPKPGKKKTSVATKTKESSKKKTNKVEQLLQNLEKMHKEGRFDEEATCYTEIVSEQPELTFAWNGLGIALECLERYDDAIAAFDQSLILDNTQGVIWQAMTRVLCLLGRYSDASIAVDRAIELAPEDASLLSLQSHIQKLVQEISSTGVTS